MEQSHYAGSKQAENIIAEIIQKLQVIQGCHSFVKIKIEEN